MFYALVLTCTVLLFNSCFQQPTHYSSMPTGDDFDKALGELLAAAELGEDPEYFNLGYSFTDINNPEHNSANIFADVYQIEENRIFDCGYSMVDHRKVGRKDGVTLQSGRGKDAEKVTDYEDFKHVLFKRSDFPSGSELDKLFEIALEKCNGKLENPAVKGCSFTKNGEPNGKIDIKVGEKGSPSDKGYVYFDAKGNFIKASIR